MLFRFNYLIVMMLFFFAGSESFLFRLKVLSKWPNRCAYLSPDFNTLDFPVAEEDEDEEDVKPEDPIVLPAPLPAPLRSCCCCC